MQIGIGIISNLFLYFYIIFTNNNILSIRQKSFLILILKYYFFLSFFQTQKYNPINILYPLIHDLHSVEITLRTT